MGKRFLLTNQYYAYYNTSLITYSLNTIKHIKNKKNLYLINTITKQKITFFMSTTKE